MQIWGLGECFDKATEWCQTEFDMDGSGPYMGAVVWILSGPSWVTQNVKLNVIVMFTFSEFL